MIQEFITTDGEVISVEENAFYTKVLNHIPDEELTSCFLKKNLLKKVRENHKVTNGDNGLSIIQLRSLFSFEEIKQALEYLQEKNQIQKREGINNDLYFLNTKNK